MTLEIKLTKNQVTLVDDADYEWLSQWKWYCRVGNTGKMYAVRDQSGIRMHRVIMNAPDSMEVDHRNGNGLDNQRDNLRICTHANNAKNRLKTQGSSIYKGVSWFKHIQKWHAYITCDYKTVRLGYFTNEIDAALAYDAKAKELFGEYARLNFGDK